VPVRLLGRRLAPDSVVLPLLLPLMPAPVPPEAGSLLIVLPELEPPLMSLLPPMVEELEEPAPMPDEVLPAPEVPMPVLPPLGLLLMLSELEPEPIEPAPVLCANAAPASAIAETRIAIEVFFIWVLLFQ
jgi:hypothetical protein